MDNSWFLSFFFWGGVHSKILVFLFVILMIDYCCSLVVAPHKFLQVGTLYQVHSLVFWLCCCFPHH